MLSPFWVVALVELAAHGQASDRFHGVRWGVVEDALVTNRVWWQCREIAGISTTLRRYASASVSARVDAKAGCKVVVDVGVSASAKSHCSARRAVFHSSQRPEIIQAEDIGAVKQSEWYCASRSTPHVTRRRRVK